MTLGEQIKQAREKMNFSPGGFGGCRLECSCCTTDYFGAGDQFLDLSDNRRQRCVL